MRERKSGEKFRPLSVNPYLCGKENDEMNLVDSNMDRIAALCRKHKVRRLFVFGSVLTGRFTEDSDVDFVVDFDRGRVEDYFDNFFELKYALEEALGRKVDLLEEQAIHNRFLRENISRTQKLIYG